MEMIFQCPHCNAEYQLPGSLADSEAECPDCGEIITIPPLRLGPGVIIGGFRLEKHLGHGSMGDVFLATQISMGRKVAVKLLPQAMTVVEESVNRFLHEVQTSAKMEHPNIVTAFDAGQDNGTYFLAMSYVEGDNYDDMVRQDGPISEDRAIDVCISAAKGLKYAWDEHRLLHRDIKPGNIMVDRHGTIKLMDMGISKSIHEDASLTVPGLVVGTPHYMSPEQAWSEDALDFRSDLYAVGATLYMLMTGRPPYVGSSQSVFTMLIRPEPFPHPKTLNPAISDQLSALILTMMAAKADDRYQTWDELIAEANRVRSGQMPLRAQPARPHEPQLVPPAPGTVDSGDSGLNSPPTKGTVSLTLKKRGPGTTTTGSPTGSDPGASDVSTPAAVATTPEAPAAAEAAPDPLAGVPADEPKLSSLGNTARIEPKVKAGQTGARLRRGPAEEHEIPVGENSTVMKKNPNSMGAGSDSAVVTPPEEGKSSGLRLKKPQDTSLPKAPDGIVDKQPPPSDEQGGKKKSGGKTVAMIVGPIVIVALIGILGAVFLVTRGTEPETPFVPGASIPENGITPPTIVNVPEPATEDPFGEDPVATIPEEPEEPPMTAEEIAAEIAAITEEAAAAYAEAVDGVRINEEALARRLGLEWPIEDPTMSHEEVAEQAAKLAAAAAERQVQERNVSTEADNRFSYVKPGEYVKVTYEKDGKTITVDGLLRQVTSSRVRIGDTIIMREDLAPEVAARFDKDSAAKTMKAFIEAEERKTQERREAYIQQVKDEVNTAVYTKAGYVQQNGRWVPPASIYNPAAEKELEREKKRLQDAILKSTYAKAGYTYTNGEWVKK